MRPLAGHGSHTTASPTPDGISRHPSGHGVITGNAGGAGAVGGATSTRGVASGAGPSGESVPSSAASSAPPSGGDAPVESSPQPSTHDDAASERHTTRTTRETTVALHA